MNALVAADLRAAADVLERDGWTQGNYHELISEADYGSCRHCLMGAVAVAVSGERTPDPDNWFATSAVPPRYDAARHVLKDYLRDPIPWMWNDAPGRTAEEVIAALRAAADRAEADQ